MRTYLTNEQTKTEDQERLESLEKENHMLKMQNNALSDQYQFLESVVTEIIMKTY